MNIIMNKKLIKCGDLINMDVHLSGTVVVVFNEYCGVKFSDILEVQLITYDSLTKVICFSGTEFPTNPDKIIIGNIVKSDIHGKGEVIMTYDKCCSIKFNGVIGNKILIYNDVTKADVLSRFEKNDNGEKIELIKSRIEKTHESCGKSYMIRDIYNDDGCPYCADSRGVYSINTLDNSCANCEDFRTNSMSYPSGKCHLHKVGCEEGEYCKDYSKRLIK